MSFLSLLLLFLCVLFLPVMDLQPEVNALIEHTTNLQCFAESDTTTPLDNEFTLVARILTDKTINLGAFKTTILKAWNPKKRVTTNILQNNLMAFIFEYENDINKIFNHSWAFRDLQIIVRKWPPDLSLNEINLDRAYFWIQALNIPVCFINLNTAKLIENNVGTFLKSDLNSPSPKWKKALRIMVEIDLHQPLQSSLQIPCHGRPNLLVELRYECLADFCYKCGWLGHKFLSCASANNEMDMDSSKFVFGPWIKAENMHIPNPLFIKNLQKPTPPKPQTIPLRPETPKWAVNPDTGCSSSPESPSSSTTSLIGKPISDEVWA